MSRSYTCLAPWGDEEIEIDWTWDEGDESCGVASGAEIDAVRELGDRPFEWSPAMIERRNDELEALALANTPEPEPDADAKADALREDGR